jgi:hypothetical protein
VSEDCSERHGLRAPGDRFFQTDDASERDLILSVTQGSQLEITEMKSSTAGFGQYQTSVRQRSKFQGSLRRSPTGALNPREDGSITIGKSSL